MLNRVTLTLVDVCHAGEMYPILADPSLHHFTGGEPPANLAAVQQWFAALAKRESPDGAQRWLTWIVRLATDDTAIGYVQATITGEHAEIAWLIGTHWQGQGYAREATGLLMEWLAETAVKQVSANIHPHHRVSQRVAEHIGLARSGAWHEGEETWVS